jgi:hypothetical protein
LFKSEPSVSLQAFKNEIGLKWKDKIPTRFLQDLKVFNQNLIRILPFPPESISRLRSCKHAGGFVLADIAKKLTADQLFANIDSQLAGD